MKKVISEIPNSIECVEGVECLSSEEVFNEFNEASNRNEEGIIIKKLDSTYKPNDRNHQEWIKLKSEYIEELGDTFDLVIIGGFFGTQKR